MKIRKMSNAEDIMYQTINNDQRLHDRVLNSAGQTVQATLVTMDIIYRYHIKNYMPDDLRNAGIQFTVVFCHLIDSMGLIHKLDNSFKLLFEKDCPEALEKEPGIGDKVTHSCGTDTSTDMNAVIIRNGDSHHWIVEYDDSGREGTWLKKYTIFRKDKIKPETKHITDPVNNGKLIIREHGDNLTDLKNVQEEIIGHLENATEHFKKVAEHFPPVTNKLKPEKTMKATIKETYINGVLVSTEINDNNINDMSSSDILHNIGNTEEAISKLKKHDGKSIFVKQETARLKAFVKDAYTLLDDKFSDEEA